MKEAQLHQAFSKWLDVRGIPFVHSRTDRRTTSTVGDCDFYVFWMGRMIGVELKIMGGKLSPAQVDRIAYIRRSGCRVEVCYSLEACIAAAESILCDSGAPAASGENLEGGDESCVRTVAATIHHTSNADSSSTGAAKFNPEAAPETHCENMTIDKNGHFQVQAPSAQSSFRIARILGREWVVCPNLDGIWDRIRLASALDVANFERAR